jgi:soluble lytic murein transglycosylase
MDLARAELALNRPGRARAILLPIVSSDSANVVALTLLGTAEYHLAQFEVAGRLFSRATEFTEGRERGILAARAGDAFERAEDHARAASHYRAAAGLLVPIADWLAVREARVVDEPIRALDLLRRTPPEAERFASRVRAQVFLDAGDSTRAMTAHGRAEEWTLATDLALAVGDTLAARRFAYEGIGAADGPVVQASLAHVEAAFPPRSPDETYWVANAYRRTGDAEMALQALRQLAEAGDSSGATLRRIGDLLSGSGKTREAVDVYARAATRGGADGMLAAYRRARALSRVGRAAEGYAALAEFADRYPGHANAPLTLYLVASWHGRSGRASTADSVYVTVSQRWPTATYAGRARMALASSALARGDTAGAIGWYRAEVESGTTETRAARFFLAQLQAASGDTASALVVWTRLATVDSLGYYGTIARGAAGITEPNFAVRGERRAMPAVAVTLRRLDLLTEASLREEADEVVQRQMARREMPADEALALAEGLIDRGWVQEGVTLGWRASRLRTLNDEHVLRVVFPWPLRALIEEEAAEHDVDPHLLAALIRQESNFRPQVVSRAGARGLMQLMPATARGLARRHGIEWDPRLLTTAGANLHLGAAHLAALLRMYDGDVIAALAAYNAGGTPVARWLRYPEAKDPARFVERIPYVETRGYLRSVLRNWSLYRGLYPPAPAPAGGGR